MRQLKTHARVGLWASALLLAGAPSAFAQDSCTNDEDCGHGYTCESFTACPDIACAEGSDCDLPECESSSSCVPKRDCTEDAECAAGWKCATYTYEECDGGAAEDLPCASDDPDCSKAEPSPTPEPAECRTREESYCTPPWTLPCETADDCGPGFECIEQIPRCASGSSGGGSEPSPGAGGAGGADGEPPPDEDVPAEDLIAPPDCGDEATGIFVCELIETSCTSDTDCGAGLTCQEQASAVSCGGASAGSAGGNGSGGAGGGDSGDGDSGGGDSDGTPSGDPEGEGSDADRALPAECETPEPTYACAPPDYHTGWDAFDGRGEAASGSDGNTHTGGTPTVDDDEGGEEPPVLSSPGSGNPEAESGDSMESSSGCSATGAGASGSALLMALSVLGLARRRTRRV